MAATGTLFLRNGVITLYPLGSDPANKAKGDLWVDIADGFLIVYDGTTNQKMVSTGATQTLTNKTLTSPVINSPTGITKADVGLGNVDNTSDATKNAAAATLTNKTIDSASNTITIDGDEATVEDLDLTSLKTNITDASKFLNRNASGVVVSNEKAVPVGDVVGTSDSQVLTNKTLNSPVINTPTGITKSDVGLGNVDNTSDATKNSAVAVLTNKTIDGDSNTVQDLPITAIKTNLTDASKFMVRDASGVPTSATKAVPAGDVVGTSDTQSLSAKTLAAPIISDYTTYTDQGGDPSTPASGKTAVYTKSGDLYTKDDAGNVTQLSGVSIANLPSAGASFNGTATAATYSRSGNTITVTQASHGMATGQKIWLRITSGTATSGSYTITVTGASTYTVTDVASGATSGNCFRDIWITSSFNVSTIQRITTGVYEVTFTTPMTYQYGIFVSPITSTSSGLYTFLDNSNTNLNKCRYSYFNNTGTVTLDQVNCGVLIYGGT